MKKTFDQLCSHLEEAGTHRFIPGRRSSRLILDMMEKGYAALESERKGLAVDVEDPEADKELRPEIEDVAVDI